MKSLLEREQVLVLATLAAIYFFKQHLTLLVSHLGLCQERLVPSSFIGAKLENPEWNWTGVPEGTRFRTRGAPMDVEEREPLSRLGLWTWPDSL